MTWWACFIGYVVFVGGGGGYILIGVVLGVCLGVYFIYYYNGYIFIIRLNMELCVSAKVSFASDLCLLKLYVWNRSSVFSDWPLFCMCSISNVWSVVPYVWPVASIVEHILSSVRFCGLGMFFTSDFKCTLYVLFVQHIWVVIHCIVF
jgi:hypothetical protein